MKNATGIQKSGKVLSKKEIYRLVDSCFGANTSFEVDVFEEDGEMNVNVWYEDYLSLNKIRNRLKLLLPEVHLDVKRDYTTGNLLKACCEAVIYGSTWELDIEGEKKDVSLEQLTLAFLADKDVPDFLIK